MDRDIQRVTTGNQWEAKYRYSRAIRHGDRIFVGGTAPIDDDGSTFAPGDGHAQATRCYEIIERALAELGSNRHYVLRCTMYVTDIDRSDQFGSAHAEFFGETAPCLTMVEVSRLVAPDMLVEIECDAVRA